MSNIADAFIAALAEDIRSMAGANNSFTKDALESFLDEKLGNMNMAERLEAIDALMTLFPSNLIGLEADRPLTGEQTIVVPREETTFDTGGGNQNVTQDALCDPGFAQLLSLMLGKRMAVADFSPAELSEKLAQALNTVFDTLNQIVEMIQVNLMGQKVDQDTIRQIIGSQIGAGGADNSLQNYLDQIREAFLVAHKSFRIAALNVARDLLSELDPGKIEASSEGKLKFGPLKKAEFFEIYKEKFADCLRWLESGRVMEGFLREFENACRKMYKR